MDETNQIGKRRINCETESPYKIKFAFFKMHFRLKFHKKIPFSSIKWLEKNFYLPVI